MMKANILSISFLVLSGCMGGGSDTGGFTGNPGRLQCTKGDINNDGNIDRVDFDMLSRAALTRQNIRPLSRSCITWDLDGDNSLTQNDVNVLGQMLNMMKKSRWSY